MEKDNKDTKKASPTEEDKELADLLDSALEDFTKSPKKTEDKTKEKKDDETKEIEDVAQALPEEIWSKEFISDAAQSFESQLAGYLKEAGGPDLSAEKLQESFQRMAEAAKQVASNPTENSNDSEFANSITQALRGLSEGTEGLQAPFNEQDIMSMFGGAGETEENNFVPFMQGMMQSLLSKEVLYPSLKDILAKYPTWLQANGGSLTPEDRHKYEQQQELMKQVCTQLEKENPSDTADQKKVQFETVLGLMQKLQDFGQPPADIVGELGSGLPFDPQGNPDMNQCCLM